MIYVTPRYNGLLAIINKTIKDLRLAIRGQIVMTEELEKIAAALFDNQVGTKDSSCKRVLVVSSSTHQPEKHAKYCSIGQTLVSMY